jgi:hypothetical protein
MRQNIVSYEFSLVFSYCFSLIFSPFIAN